MMYKDFFEFWDANSSGREEAHVEHIALMAWDAAVNGMTMDCFSNSEVYTEAVIRGFEVKRTDKSDQERNEQ